MSVPCESPSGRQTNELSWRQPFVRDGSTAAAITANV